MTETMHQALECPICMDQFIDARQLPCGHSFCEGCRETLLVFNGDGSATLQCPNKCRKTTDIQSDQTLNDVLHKNFVVESFLDNLKKDETTEMMRCSEHNCHNLITRYCSGFQKKICNSCLDKHLCDVGKHYLLRFDHCSDSFQPVCREHNTFDRIVCVECNSKLICLYCQHRTHKGHELKDLASYATELRIHFASLLISCKGIQNDEDCQAEDDQLDDYKDELCKELHIRKMVNVNKYIVKLNEEEKEILKTYDDEKEKYRSQRKCNIDYLNHIKLFPFNTEDFTVATGSAIFLQKPQNLSRTLHFSVRLQDSTSISNLGNMEVKLINKIPTHAESSLNTQIETRHWKQYNAADLSEALLKAVEELTVGDRSCSWVPTLKRIESYSLEDKKKLIEDVNSITSAKETKLMLFSEVVLLEKKENVVDYYFHAVKCGNSNLLKMILQLDNDIIDLYDNISDNTNGTGYDRKTALMYASENGHVDCVALILKHNCDVDMQSIEEGATALMYASARGHADCVKLLLQHNCHVNMKSSQEGGQTALMYASEAGHVDCVTLLLQHDCDVDMESGTLGRTALMIASARGHADCVKLLLQYNCHINMKSSQVRPLDSWKASGEGYSIIEIGSQEGKTALMYASEAGHADCVKLLLQHNCDVDMESGTLGRTALMIASARGHADCVKLLLRYNCDVDMKDLEEKTALMYASEEGDADCITLLLQYNSDAVRTKRQKRKYKKVKKGQKTKDKNGKIGCLCCCFYI